MSYAAFESIFDDPLYRSKVTDNIAIEVRKHLKHGQRFVDSVYSTIYIGKADVLTEKWFDDYCISRLLAVHDYNILKYIIFGSGNTNPYTMYGFVARYGRMPMLRLDDFDDIKLVVGTENGEPIYKKKVITRRRLWDYESNKPLNIWVPRMSIITECDVRFRTKFNPLWTRLPSIKKK